MKLLAPLDVTLRLNAPWSHHALPQSEVFAEGHDTGQVVTGEVLKAAIKWDSYCLLLVTDNIPFEDSLHAYLFDAHWKLADSATLGRAAGGAAAGAGAATEAFSGLTLVQPNFVCFQYTGGDTWTLELLDHGVVALPFFDPKGVERPFSMFRRFKLHSHPVLEGAY